MFSTLDFKEFGEQVKQVRKNAKFTQKYVSDTTGINIDTIRRIENGLVIPKYETLELLSNTYKIDLLKLVSNLRQINPIFKLYKELDQIIIHFSNESSYRYDKIKKLIDENTDIGVNPLDVLLLSEFITISKIILNEINYDYDFVLNKLNELMKLAIPSFSFKKFNQFCYSEFEIRILILLGITYQDKNKSALSIEIFEFCLNYMILTTSNDDLSSLQLKIKLYYNLSYAHYKIENDLESLRFADLGINLCNNHKVHYLLEMLLVRKAVAQFYLKNDEYMHSFYKALFLLHSLEQYDKLDYLIKTTKEKHHIDLTEIYTVLRNYI